MGGIDLSAYSDCTDLSSTECLCANKDALTELTDAAKSACETAGIGKSCPALFYLIPKANEW